MELVSLWCTFLVHISLYNLVASHNDSIKNECAPGLRTKGYTVPKGDIYIEVGNSLEIFCILNPDVDAFNSSSLIFYQNETLVPQEYLTIVNRTSVRLFIDSPPPGVSNFMCKKKGDPVEPICLNSVFVGYKPDIKNFSCFFYNWQSVNCSWIPLESFVPTKFTILYKIPGVFNTRIQCPSKNTEKNSCFWGESTVPPYRQPYATVGFKLTGVNKFGNSTFRIEYNHFASITPEKPKDLTLIDATSNSLTIGWFVPDALRNFNAGVVHKVEYQAWWEPNVWNVVNTTHLPIKNTNWTLKLTNLKYSHCLYDIRVFMRSAKAVSPELWSQPATINLRTKPSVPGMSPRTIIGSYELKKTGKDTRDITVYWQQIPKFEENSEKIEYRFVSVKENGKEVTVHPENISKTFAKFKGLSFNSYVFKIVAFNSEGDSSPPSEIYVPSQNDTLEGPVLKNIAYEREFDLTWTAPRKDIDTYTLFWCPNNKDRPYPCNGLLNWTVVSGNMTHWSVSDLVGAEIYQFAISANKGKASSGMVWASCTLLADQAVGGKINIVLVKNIGSTYLELMWKLDCSDHIGVVEAYNITYCPIKSPTEDVCTEPMQNKTVKIKPGVNGFESANVTGLKPYKTYVVFLKIITKNWTGLDSDPIYATLNEAAPSVPQSVTVSDVTNDSVNISWLPPKQTNGVLRNYKIIWENGTSETAEGTHKTITDLLSFTNYSFSVSACTVSCSKKSSPVSFTTKAGRPGIMDPPVVRFIDLTKAKLNISWSPLPPQKRGGFLDHYDIRFQVFSGNEVTNNVTYTTRDLNKEIETEECFQNLVYRISIRAVNINPVDNISYPGPWSKDIEGNCFDLGIGLYTIIIISIAGVLALIVTCLCCGIFTRTIYIKWKTMKNVQIKLPPNLTANNFNQDKGKDNDYQVSMHVWSPHVPDNPVTYRPPPDRQLLLEKKEKEDLLDSSVDEGEDTGENRESSGCGSGHGSVSSSINGTEQISSDSGTEADQRGSSPDVFSESASEQCLLEQRNASSDGYCRVAPAPGYVAMPTTSPPRGYIMHPAIWSNASSTAPPKGYVVAAPPPTQTVPPPTTYCLLAWKPSDQKANRDCVFPNPNPADIDHVTDSEGVSNSQVNGPLNQTSSI